MDPTFCFEKNEATIQSGAVHHTIPPISPASSSPQILTARLLKGLPPSLFLPLLFVPSHHKGKPLRHRIDHGAAGEDLLVLKTELAWLAADQALFAHTPARPLVIGKIKSRQRRSRVKQHHVLHGVLYRRLYLLFISPSRERFKSSVLPLCFLNSINFDRQTGAPATAMSDAGAAPAPKPEGEDKSDAATITIRVRDQVCSCLYREECIILFTLGCCTYSRSAYMIFQIYFWRQSGRAEWKIRI